MPKHVALVIGISEYRLLPKLTYAQKDAELMGQFLSETAGFNTQQGGGVCLCTHNSPEYKGYSTCPTRTELRRILRKGFTESFLSYEDCFWFFFSGHGVRYDDKDYLMPADGDPEEPDATAIELNYVTERLPRSGAGQVVMILDACRSEGQKSSLHGFGQNVAKGVTTLFSCHPKEPSYEIGEPICHSAFTHVLLQSFRQQTPETALTVSKLEQYLQTEVPKLNQQHNKPPQMPHIRCEAASGNKILLPHLLVSLTEDFLNSDKGVFYRLLRSLLKAGNWETANKVTFEAVKHVLGKEDSDWFSDFELKNFPCTDLLMIDSLWMDNSEGRFGLSIQKGIYESISKELNHLSDKDMFFNKFSRVLGWRRQEDDWCDDLIFDISAPLGHLPCLLFGPAEIKNLFTRIDSCNSQQ